MIKPAEKQYLFSIDLEDVRDMIPNGHSYVQSVEKNTFKYLAWLKRHNFKCTFFVVGKTALCHPDLIKEIVLQGHEVACHTHNHIHLTLLSESEFKADLDYNIAALLKCGVAKVKGFRAPTFSLVERTKWVYPILKASGIEYSTSVIPNSNPLFGWKNFGGEQWIDGIYEIPMNLGKTPFNVPFGGGVYFRMLPAFFLKRLFNQSARAKEAVLGYFHPYDIDVDQERFMHPHISNNPLLNQLMYINRSRVFDNLDYLVKDGFIITRYDEYFKSRTISGSGTETTTHR